MGDRQPTILEMLDLEPIEPSLYRSTLTFVDVRKALFGGQVAAQALLAAARTVPAGRLPHSLHGYYLRPGNSLAPTLLRVENDRDGRSFSARRVLATQDGVPIFTMLASFHVAEPGWDYQVASMPDTPDPLTLPRHPMYSLFSIDGRVPPSTSVDFPTRFWMRCTEDLPDDPVIHACVLTYFSDISHAVLPDPATGARARASLDHAVWFHRPVDAGKWMLTDFQPGTAARARGWYAGSVFAANGELVASIGQEMLVR